MDQAEVSLPAESEPRWDVALSMSDPGPGNDRLHVAVIEHIGDAMRGWDSATGGDSWTPSPVQEETRRDLPPLRLREPRDKD
jgi:hypothetical protein